MSKYLETGLESGTAGVSDIPSTEKLLPTYARNIYFDLHLLLKCYDSVAQRRGNEEDRLAEAEQIAYEVLPSYGADTRRMLAKFCLKPWPVSDLLMN